MPEVRQREQAGTIGCVSRAAFFAPTRVITPRAASDRSLLYLRRAITITKVRTLLSRRRVPAPGGWYSGYFGAVAGPCFAECWIEPFPITIASLPNGGAAFAGKSGRNTANACEANAMETTMITAAHLMVGALIRF